MTRIDFRRNQDVKRINAILSRWKKLRVLNIPNGMISFGMNLKKHKLLRKIVVSRAMMAKVALFCADSQFAGFRFSIKK